IRVVRATPANAPDTRSGHWDRLIGRGAAEANHAGTRSCPSGRVAPEACHSRKIPAAKALYAIPDCTRTSACDSSLIAGDVRANIYGRAVRLESDVRRPKAVNWLSDDIFFSLLYAL